MLHTRRGVVQTPVFMPVATRATFRHVGIDEAAQAGAPIVLGEHLPPDAAARPRGVPAVGGIHRFMRWDGPVLTDSGGYQIFSLPADRTITEKGARFRSFHDNSRQLLSPESSIEMQKAIGSDIMMVLDVVHRLHGRRARDRGEAMERTHRWALRSLARDAADTGQALFAIVQGGVFPALRARARRSSPRHAVRRLRDRRAGGGRDEPQRGTMTALAAALLPADRPRYLMGVGTPLDLLEAVRARRRHVRLHHPDQDGVAGLRVHLRGPGARSPGRCTALDEPLDPRAPARLPPLQPRATCTT